MSLFAIVPELVSVFFSLAQRVLKKLVTLDIVSKINSTSVYRVIAFQ